jgi:hypothetical protein
MTNVSRTLATNDVLIVGAGPIGLTLVNNLLRRGIRCRIIDSAPRAVQNTKALGIHAKTLELLAKMGVAHTAIERGLKSPGFRLYSDGKPHRAIHRALYPFSLSAVVSLRDRHGRSAGGYGLTGRTLVSWDRSAGRIRADRRDAHRLLFASGARKRCLRARCRASLRVPGDGAAGSGDPLGKLDRSCQIETQKQISLNASPALPLRGVQ